MLKEKLSFVRSKVRVPNKFISETNKQMRGWHSYKVTVHVGQEVANTLNSRDKIMVRPSAMLPGKEADYCSIINTQQQFA